MKKNPGLRPNPFLHRMVGEFEVTAWPDGVVGVAVPGTVVNFLLSPDLAVQLAAALTEMASVQNQGRAGGPKQ